MAMSEAAEQTALRQRFPKLSPFATAYQGLTIFASNGYLLYLLLQGETSPTAFATYGVLELIAYSAISNTTLLAVPKDLRVGSPDLPLSQRLVAIVTVAAFLCGIAWISLPDREHIEQLRQASNPIAALRDLNILWPLLLSIAMAVSGSIGDLLRWRERGGPFVTGMAMFAASKFMTAIIAPPAAALLAGVWSGPNAAHQLVIWSVVYLAIKCGLEVLMSVWQFLGMPDGDTPANRTAPSTRGSSRTAGKSARSKV